MVETAKIIWADGPSIAPYEPSKYQIRAWGTWLENLTSALGLAATATYIRGSKAQLDGVVGAVQGAVGIVVADDNEDQRGIYVFLGSSWVKRLDLPVDAAQAVLEMTEDARDLALDYRNQARDARDATINYRDQAAGYVNDIASEKEVPIYGTVAGMPLVSVPVGILTINVLGRAAMLDSAMSTWQRVASEPAVAPKLKFRTVDRFLPNGSTSSTNGGWWQFVVSRPRVDQFTGQFSVQQRLDILQARMAAGQSVSIACYGDSTTDGQGTTGWTANPTSGGAAVGSGDHESTAPNAWPAVLKALLQTMHNNANIKVWNAGYTGRRLGDGWAYNNFEAAVINNPAYGVPDIVLIAFGLNDQPQAGSEIDITISETRRLCQKIMAYGAVPVLVTCDISISNASGRNNQEVSRQIDATKIALAKEVAVPTIDMSADLARWVSSNRDGFRWLQLQPDYLHFGDAGNQFKASAIARWFGRDIVTLKAGERIYLNSWDSRASGGRHDEAPYFFTDNRQGGNFVYTPEDLIASGDRLLEAWVWNEAEEMSIIYRGVETEGYTGANGLTVGNYLQVYNPLTGTFSRGLPSIGFAEASNGYKRSDMPFIIGRLPYGLNRISYRVGTGHASTGYYGCLDFMPFDANVKRRNALKNTGIFRRRFLTSESFPIDLIPEFNDGSNIYGITGTNIQDILMELVLPVGTGFIFAYSCGYGGSGGLYGDISAAQIYRISDTQVGIYQMRRVNGVLTVAGTAIATGTVTNDPVLSLKLRLFRSGDTQKVQLFQGFNNSTALIDATIAQTAIPVHFAGVVGGFYCNTNVISGNVLCEARSVVTEAT